MNTKQKIKSLWGREMEQSYAPQEDVEDLPKGADGKPDRSKLPRETVGNVVLNSLAVYNPANRKEAFFIQNVANRILESKGEIKLSSFETKLIAKVMDAVTGLEPIDPKAPQAKSPQIYRPWVAVQIYEALGLEPDLSKVPAEEPEEE